MLGLLFDWAAKRGASRTTEREVLKGAGLDRAYVIYAMKQLDQYKLGKFTVGRRNKPSRMNWDVDLGELGKIAQGLADDFEDPALSHGFSPRAPEVPDPGLDDILHVFHLRPELAFAEIAVKSDGSGSEATGRFYPVVALRECETVARTGAKMSDLHLSRMRAREPSCFATAFLAVSTS